MSLVLADTSIWVEHFRRANPVLQALAAGDQLLCHPLIVLEVACGSPPAPRQRTIEDMRALQHAVVATHDETLTLMESEHLHASGCGAIDVSLLASVMLTPGAALWTSDKKLNGLARRLAIAFAPV
jgi:predicted nucleic acid-binding protein